MPVPITDDPEELHQIAEAYPGYCISPCRSHDNAPRYAAQARSLEEHPYAVITSDLGELRAALIPRPRSADGL